MPKYPQTSFAPPPGSTRITLVRHGQTEPADPDGPDFPVKDGHGDPSLTDLGARQAISVADRLEDELIDAIYVTSLIRTHQTAAPLVERLGITPGVEADLREVFLGEWEGGLFRHMLALQEHPGAIAFRQTYEWGSVPGAETNAELTARTSAALERIRQAHPDEHVVCFVHGGVIAALCSFAAESHMRPFAGADNCSLHRLVLTDERWILRGYNDINHLGELRTPPADVTQHA